MTSILAFGVELPLWAYIVFGGLALVLAVGGAVKTIKDKKKAAAKKAESSARRRR